MSSAEVDAFWQAYLGSLPADHAERSRAYEVWRFGHDARLGNQLAELARSGIKTATSGLVWEDEVEGVCPPQVGEIFVVTNWNGEPRCIIEIVEVEVRPFNQVDEQFAFDYGEGERSLAWWRRALWAFYAKICESLGREPSETMRLVCLRFRLLLAA